MHATMPPHLKFATLTVAVNAALFTSFSVQAAEGQLTNSQLDTALQSKSISEEPLPSVTMPLIIVTAQKIDRSFENTVGSIGVTTADDLDDNPSLSKMQDVLRNTANVTSDGEDGLTIRGVTNFGPTGTGNSSVYSIVIDGVSQTEFNDDIGDISMWDVKQVEVLRGSQSTTAGRNALAGAVFVESNDPTFYDTGKVQLGYGSDNTYQQAMASSGAVSDRLAYRLSAEKKHTDGQVTNNNFDEGDWNSSDIVTVRGKLLYDLNDTNDVQLMLSNSRFDEQGQPFSSQPDNFINTDNQLSSVASHKNNATVTFKSQLTDEWALKTITAYNDTNFKRVLDSDEAQGLARLNTDRFTDKLSQEVLLSHTSPRSKAVVGLFAETGEFDYDILFENLTLPFPIPGTTDVIPVSINYNNQGREDYDNYAVFFNADYKLTDQLTLLSGLRYDYDSRHSNQDPKGTLAQSLGSPAFDAYAQQVLSDTVGYTEGDFVNREWLPKLGLDYKWNDQLSTGLVYQRGYRPGGTSLNLVTAQAVEFAPEFTDNYEISIRFTDPNERYVIKSNIFYTDWQDQQVSIAGDTGVAYDTYVENAGSSHLYGMELEGTWQATKALRVNGGLGLLKTEFDDYLSNGRDYSGKEFKRARGITANLGATYQAPFGWFLGGYATHQGEGWQDVSNDKPLESYTLFNLKTGYKTDAWGAYVYVNNAFDTQYSLLDYDFAGDPVRYYLPGADRSVGLTINYNW